MKFFLRLLFASVILAAGLSADAAPRRIGNWWWHYSDATNAELCANYLDELQKACVSEIYFYGYTKLENKSGYREELHAFVQKAMARGMRVAILFDDWDDFFVYDGLYFRTKLLPWFLEYKQTYPNDAVYGFHFDIEKPKSVPSYSQEVFQNYCDHFIGNVQVARAAGVHCEVDVACGWNSKGAGEVVYHSVTGLYNIVAKYMDTMSIMSYRDEASKIISFANNAPLPAAIANGCDFLLGVETANAGEGDQVDFSAEDKPYLFGEMDRTFELLDAMNLSVGYGMAIHHTRTFYNLPGTVPDGNGRNTWGVPSAPECKSVSFGSVGNVGACSLKVADPVPGVYYTAFASSDLSGPYTAVGDSIPCIANDAGQLEFQMPDLGEKGFYKITASTAAFHAGDAFPAEP